MHNNTLDNIESSNKLLEQRSSYKLPNQFVTSNSDDQMKIEFNASDDTLNPIQI